MTALARLTDAITDPHLPSIGAASGWLIALATAMTMLLPFWEALCLTVGLAGFGFLLGKAAER